MGEVKLTPEKHAELRKRRAAGESLRAIAAALGVSHERVRQVLDGDDPKPQAAPRPAIGEVCGRLTVTAEALRGRHGQRRVWCSCACGNLSIVSANNLTSGETQSCGCLRRERLAQSRRRYITIGGRTQHLGAWLQEVGLSHRCVWLRLRAGWTIEEAITRPRQEGKRLDGGEKRTPRPKGS